MVRVLKKVDQMFVLTMAPYNLTCRRVSEGRKIGGRDEAQNAENGFQKTGEFMRERMK
jgi:hypothetical protein